MPFALTAVVACSPAAARAEDGALDLVSPETIEIYGDVRAVAADGERSWVDGGFGKLRYGGKDADRPSDLRLKPEFGEAGVVWQPRFGWAFSGTVVALAQGRGDDVEAGLSEAFVSFKPLGGGPVKVSARAGLMWPHISLEHGGPEWAVNDAISPSAIGAWIGEEVKVVGLEVSASGKLGGHELSATVAGFDFNDTAGALLTFRGWAMHDRKALAFRKQPLPAFNAFIEQVQPPYSHPLLDFERGVFKRPGYYAKLAWTAPFPLHVEYVHYDNNGDPEAVNANLEWGWRTQFDSLGVIADFGKGRELRAQGMTGRTRMGFAIDGRDWIDMRFRAAYGQLTQRFDKGAVSARVDVFSTRNRGSVVDAEDDEDGWAITVAAKRELVSGLTLLAEYLRVDSEREARLREALAPEQTQNQLQMVLRAHW